MDMSYKTFFDKYFVRAEIRAVCDLDQIWNDYNVLCEYGYGSFSLMEKTL